jgi:hypothetical protein
MRALPAAELLDVWERGLAQSPAQRALTLLVAACRDAPIEKLAQFSVGERDACLLAFREETFGSRLASLTQCPACAEQVELQIETSDLYVAKPEAEALLRVNMADHAIEFRLPTSLDVASLDPTADAKLNRQQLLQRCVISARRGEVEVTPAELPDEAVAAVTRRMSEIDPQADVQLSLTCPRCQHAWQTPLDIVSYFWSEIHAWAHRTLREIHILAAAYGWREAEVLALNPWRRHAYLELIQS